jgi:hypothetical protein
MKELITLILRDINYNNNQKNRNLIKNLILERTNNIHYIWSKIPNLLNKISHTKGFLGLSNSKQMIKISFDKDNVSKEIKEEFHNIVDNWSKKYNISLAYDFKKETYYIK